MEHLNISADMGDEVDTISQSIQDNGGDMLNKKWDLRFIELAKHISGWSKDPSTKVGCVVVGEDREIRSTGFNGFPRGIDDNPERLANRETKYPLICHAEEEMRLCMLLELEFH